MLAFDNLLKVLMIWVALCSITAKKTNRLVYEICLEPPISFATSLSHSIVSKMRSIRPMIPLASF